MTCRRNSGRWGVGFNFDKRAQARVGVSLDEVWVAVAQDRDAWRKVV